MFKFHKTTLPHDMVSPKEDASTSDEHVEKLSREYNIKYKACARLIINILSTRVDLYFSVKIWNCFCQIIVKYILMFWYTCWYTLGTPRTWG